MSFPEGISMRFKQPLVFHPESSAFVVCGCGQSFGPYFGVKATEKARAFMAEHPCHLKEAPLGRRQHQPREYPYSAEELLLASEQPPDEYHRHLMAWAAKRIIELEGMMKKPKGKGGKKC